MNKLIQPQCNDISEVVLLREILRKKVEKVTSTTKYGLHYNWVKRRQPTFLSTATDRVPGGLDSHLAVLCRLADKLVHLRLGLALTGEVHSLAVSCDSLFPEQQHRQGNDAWLLSAQNCSFFNLIKFSARWIRSTWIELGLTFRDNFATGEIILNNYHSISNPWE